MLSLFFFYFSFVSSFPSSFFLSTPSPLSLSLLPFPPLLTFLLFLPLIPSPLLFSHYPSPFCSFLSSIPSLLPCSWPSLALPPFPYCLFSFLFLFSFISSFLFLSFFFFSFSYFTSLSCLAIKPFQSVFFLFT